MVQDDTIHLYDLDLELDYNQLTGTLPNWSVQVEVCYTSCQ